MKRFVGRVILLAVAVIFLQGCASVKPIDKKQLEGYWVLKSLKGEAVSDAFKGSIPSIEFDLDKNMVAGNSGCNRFTGAFSLDEQNVFSAPKLASTMMMCMDANKEPEFLAALSAPNTVLGFDKQGMLTLSTDKTVTMLFEKTEAPMTANNVLSAEKLAGKWNLTSIEGVEVGTLFKDKMPTMEIAADGKVFGNAGCNTYRTSYELDGNTISFKPMMRTMMACPNLDGENKFSKILESPLLARLESDKLTFSKEGKVVLEFARNAE